jgi:hypothetical protein
MNPLIIPLSQFNRALFREFGEELSFQCGDIQRLETYLQTARDGVVQQCNDKGKLSGPDDDGIPRRPVWGPVTIGEATAVTDHVDVNQFYRLVPQGTENHPQHRTADGTKVSDWAIPEAKSSLLPAVDESRIPIHPSVAPQSSLFPIIDHTERVTKYLDEAKAQLATPHAPQKLYKVSEAIEVSPEEISAEMGKQKRKNAKPAIYIKGLIVEPKLKVEI